MGSGSASPIQPLYLAVARFLEEESQPCYVHRQFPQYPSMEEAQCPRTGNVGLGWHGAFQKGMLTQCELHLWNLETGIPPQLQSQPRLQPSDARRAHSSGIPWLSGKARASQDSGRQFGTLSFGHVPGRRLRAPRTMWLLIDSRVCQPAEPRAAMEMCLKGVYNKNGPGAAGSRVRGAERMGRRPS